MPDSLQTPKGLCHHHSVDWYRKALEGVLSQREDLQSTHAWLLRELTHVNSGHRPPQDPLGKAEITRRSTQPHRSREYNCRPAEKVLETKIFHPFRKMNLSTNLLNAPKLWLLGLWFVQEKQFWRTNSLGPENTFLCSGGQFIMGLFSVTVKGGKA